MAKNNLQIRQERGLDTDNCNLQFAWDSCLGCTGFQACAKQTGELLPEETVDVYCSCGWWGSFGELGSKLVQKRTWDSPEVWEHCCPDCGSVDFFETD